MNAIIDFFKRIFGIKPKDIVTNINTPKPVSERVIKNGLKSDLNEITLKMGDTDNGLKAESDKPKRKRYYKKKPKNIEKTNEPQKETNKKTQKKPVNTEANTNGTTKKRYRSKKPKQTSTVQPESRTDK